MQGRYEQCNEHINRETIEVDKGYHADKGSFVKTNKAQRQMDLDGITPARKKVIPSIILSQEET